MAFKRLDLFRFFFLSFLFSLYPSHLLQLQQLGRIGFISFNGSEWCQSTGFIKRASCIFTVVLCHPLVGFFISTCEWFFFSLGL
jgi:hypothetical protein